MHKVLMSDECKIVKNSLGRSKYLETITHHNLTLGKQFEASGSINSTTRQFLVDLSTL